MTATYRLQLSPDFGFERARDILPYLKRLGISHLYLSPITEARQGSTHGYDVSDHNHIREELGGRDGFEALLAEARDMGLALILDFVPNHAGVGPDNAPWQDVLAYGPHSPYARVFDIDWNPLKPELKNKVLLPFLGSPYGEVLASGDLKLAWEAGRFYATYFESRFALSPITYPALLERMLPTFERTEGYFDLKDLSSAYEVLEPPERDKAEGLRIRFQAVSEQVDFSAALPTLNPRETHDLLERQFWRLSYWKTAGDEINYRRFFDVNELVGLRMETPEVFWETHRLLGELVVKEGVEGVRIDHVDGLFDPHGYLRQLKELGVRNVWVEKILAAGETLPEGWPVAGSSGYEFMNDAMGVLVYPPGEGPLMRSYRRFLDVAIPYEDEVHRAKRLVMATSLSSELTRLASELNRLSEADYHTRDFTLASLQEALAETVAAFPRYRTYLPFDQEEASEVIKEAIARAKGRNPTAELSVYGFIEKVLLGEVSEVLADARNTFLGRFQQYTAPVMAKGVEDTTFYRYVPLVALNEVGGEPSHFSVTPQAFHARARFRAFRYPDTLVATATHDHKRGEDTRMRLIVLAELPELWEETLTRLAERAQALQQERTELTPFSQKLVASDVYLFYQLLVALWVGEEVDSLTERLLAYMEKAVREAKLASSWLNPNPAYEETLKTFVRETIHDEEVAPIVGPLAEQLARFGFLNSLAQLILKLTTPGVPDFYRGVELLDLSLVDPDNRRPVDYEQRRKLLDELASMLETPDTTALQAWLAAQDERAKLYFTARLLHFRRDHPSLFSGGYRPLEAEGAQADHLLAFTREDDEGTLVVCVSRFPATLAAAGGWRDTHLPLPAELARRTWTEVLSGDELEVEEALALAALPLPFAVLFSPAPTISTSADPPF